MLNTENILEYNHVKPEGSMKALTSFSKNHLEILAGLWKYFEDAAAHFGRIIAGSGHLVPTAQAENCIYLNS